MFNPKPSLSKSFLTIGYEGSNGWDIESFISDPTEPEIFDGNVLERRDETRTVLSYVDGEYIINPADGSLVQPAGYAAAFGTTLPPYTKQRAGFDRKENKYVAALKNNSTGNPGEVSYGIDIAGIKGMTATVKISTDRNTDFRKKKRIICSFFKLRRIIVLK